MEQYISKAAVVAEINNMLKSKEHTSHCDEASFNSGRWKALTSIKKFLDTLEVKEDVVSTDTLEVKEVSEHNDVDMNHIFEEIGVSPDSHIASLFKNAFYKAVDRYLEKKIEV